MSFCAEGEVCGVEVPTTAAGGAEASDEVVGNGGWGGNGGWSGNDGETRIGVENRFLAGVGVNNCLRAAGICALR